MHSSWSKQFVEKNINELKVLTINFQNICNKREVFENLINSSDPDIIIGTETWLKPNILNSELPKSHHIVARKDRKDGHGGVIIATKVTLLCNEIEINDHDTELVAVKVCCIGNQSLIVTSAYRPTNEDADYAVNMCNAFTDMVRSNKNATIWISGDTNLPDINWKDMSVEGRNYSKQLNQTVLNTINDLGLEQAVDFPTRGQNILDTFFTNRPSLINLCKPVPGIGDHTIVFTKSVQKTCQT